MFFEGEEAYVGDRLVAAVEAVWPEHGRFGSRPLLRMQRALRGWRVLAPGRSRRPLPWPVVAGLCVELGHRGRWDMAVWVLLVFQSYLRPSEAFKLLRGDLVEPSEGLTRHWAIIVGAGDHGLTSKVGASDSSIVLDLIGLEWMAPVWAALRQGAPTSPLFGFGYHELYKEFAAAAKVLNVKAVPYQLRHSGPVWDRIRNVRTLREVQKRGRWKSTASLVRYQRQARLAADLKAFPRAWADYFRTCADVLVGCVLHGKRPPARPHM